MACRLGAVAGAVGNHRQHIVWLRRILVKPPGRLHIAPRLRKAAELQVGLGSTYGCVKVLKGLGIGLFKKLQRFGRAVNGQVNLAGKNIQGQVIVAALRLDLFQNRHRLLQAPGLHQYAGPPQRLLRPRSKGGRGSPCQQSQPDRYRGLPQPYKRGVGFHSTRNASSFSAVRPWLSLMRSSILWRPAGTSTLASLSPASVLVASLSSRSVMSILKVP